MMSLKKFLFKDYEWEQQPCRNKKGYRWKYSYKGKWKQWQIADWNLTYFKLFTGFVFLLCAVLFFYGNTILCEISRIKTVQVFTLLAFAAFFFLFSGEVFFLFSRKKMTEPDAVLQKQLMIWSSGSGAAFLLLSEISAAVFHEAPLAETDIHMLICNAIIIALQLILFILHRKLNIADI